jgi:hypothetical protein
MISPNTENYLTHNRQSTELGGEAGLGRYNEHRF